MRGGVARCGFSSGERKVRHVKGIIIVCMAFALVLSAGCSGNQSVQHPVIDRESVIPAGAEKVTPETDEFPPVLHSEEYEPPVLLPYPVTTAGGEDSPFITPDGTLLYFFFTPDVRVPAEQQLSDGVTGVYLSRNTGDGWTVPERVFLQDPGKPALDGCPTLSGSTLWFCSAREGYTGVNMFMASCSDDVCGGWQDVGDVLRGYEVGEMHITADGSELYFHSPRAGGLGGYDIWVTRNEQEKWQEPKSVAAVNTAETEGWPFVTEERSELWFTRWYQGAPAIFRSKRTAAGWQEPELIISQFAAEPTLDREGNIYFTHHYFRDGTMIEADFYVARKK